MGHYRRGTPDTGSTSCFRGKLSLRLFGGFLDPDQFSISLVFWHQQSIHQLNWILASWEASTNPQAGGSRSYSTTKTGPVPVFLTSHDLNGSDNLIFNGSYFIHCHQVITEDTVHFIVKYTVLRQPIENRGYAKHKTWMWWQSFHILTKTPKAPNHFV